jgi:hypothetical protein
MSTTPLSRSQASSYDCNFLQLDKATTTEHTPAHVLGRLPPFATASSGAKVSRRLPPIRDIGMRWRKLIGAFGGCGVVESATPPNWLLSSADTAEVQSLSELVTGFSSATVAAFAA